MKAHTPYVVRFCWLGLCTIWLGGALFTATGCVAEPFAEGSVENPAFVPLSETGARHWLGPQIWGNRLQDWQSEGDWIECVTPQDWLAMRTAHHLTKTIDPRCGNFQVEARVRWKFDSSQEARESDGAAGFLLGVGNGLMEPESTALVHEWPGRGAGFFAGVGGSGVPFLFDHESPWTLSEGAPEWREVRLRLFGEVAKEKGVVSLFLEVWSAESQVVLASTSKVVPLERMTGGVALVSHPGTKGGARKPARFAFSDWRVTGEGVVVDPTATLGPVISTQYTVSRGMLKLTAQMAALGEEDPDSVFLQIDEGEGWETIAMTRVVTPGWTAPFRVGDWEAARDTPYRVVYGLSEPGDSAQPLSWEGVIRLDPVDREELVLATLNCNHNTSHAIAGGWGLGEGEGRTAPHDWVDGVWFPHRETTAAVAAHDPDLIFFAGEQIYEGKRPTFADIAHIELDYLYKWYLWCWAYRDLTRSIPSVCIPDDHDVYQGNLWGQGGRKAPGRDNTGGYVRPASFVAMVERTQTSHLPDSPDPRPVGQGLGVYFTELLWGRVSMAILEDRKFKSGCDGVAPAEVTSGRPDHIVVPGVDPDLLDAPDLVLLGERQLSFLEGWASDWSGVDMKLALSQSPFAAMSTHHGSYLDWYAADFDANGWPRSGRDRAVSALRRAAAPHVAGDQHLAMVFQHGLETHDDGVYSFCAPAVANFYPRAWAPTLQGPFRPDHGTEVLGPFTDGFGNRVTVRAVANPGVRTGLRPTDLYDRMPGYGIVVIDKPSRTYTFECWPRHVDPLDPEQGQYEGWPVTVSQMDNLGSSPALFLPPLEVEGLEAPVVSVRDGSGSLVYSLRLALSSFRLPVFAEGVYVVEIGDGEGGVPLVVEGLHASNDLVTGLKVNYGVDH